MQQKRSHIFTEFFIFCAWCAGIFYVIALTTGSIK